MFTPLPCLPLPCSSPPCLPLPCSSHHYVYPYHVLPYHVLPHHVHPITMFTLTMFTLIMFTLTMFIGTMCSPLPYSSYHHVHSMPMFILSSCSLHLHVDPILMFTPFLFLYYYRNSTPLWPVTNLTKFWFCRFGCWPVTGKKISTISLQKWKIQY